MSTQVAFDGCIRVSVSVAARRTVEPSSSRCTTPPPKLRFREKTSELTLNSGYTIEDVLQPPTGANYKPGLPVQGVSRRVNPTELKTKEKIDAAR